MPGRPLHILDGRHTFKHPKEDLDKEEKCEDNKHGDGKDAPRRKEAIIAVNHTDSVEEKQDELLDEETDHDTVDRTPVDILVDL